MNYRLKLILTCVLATGANVSYAANLLDAYERAKESDPQLHQADAQRLAARESKPQALAGLLPTLDGSAAVSKSSSDVSGGQFLGTTTPPAAPAAIILSTSSENKVQTNQWTVTLRQPVFRWDRWSALKQADAQVAQAEATYLAAEQDLIVRVSQRYLSVLAAKDNVDNTEAAAESFSRQLEQAEKRFEVGLIAITDVQEARAQRDRSTADVIDAKRVLATNKELLREITGVDFDVLASPGDDMPLKTPDPASADKWVDAAMERNLTLISARLGVDIAKQNVKIAEAGHVPSLDLVGSYGATKTYTDTTQIFADSSTLEIPTLSNDRHGPQIGLQLTVPLFASGGTQSRVRQQSHLHRASRENLEFVTRETQRSVRDNYLGVLSGIARVKALKQALESSKVALQATEAGFDVGTRTTVDVLLSRQALFVAQTNYSQSRYTYLASMILLEQAAGQLNKDDIVEINSWLK